VGEESSKNKCFQRVTNTNRDQRLPVHQIRLSHEKMAQIQPLGGCEVLGKTDGLGSRRGEKINFCMKRLLRTDQAVGRGPWRRVFPSGPELLESRTAGQTLHNRQVVRGELRSTCERKCGEQRIDCRLTFMPPKSRTMVEFEPGANWTNDVAKALVHGPARKTLVR